MTIDDALKIVIARTGIERYRYLCLDQPDEEDRQIWCEWVVREAKAENVPDLIVEIPGTPCCGGVPLPP